MNDEKKSNDGLPDIAQQLSEKKSWIFLVVILLIALMLGFHFHGKQKVKTEKPVDEFYSVPEKKPFVKEIRRKENQSTVQKEKHVLTLEQIALIQEKQKELQQRLSAPLMIVNAINTSRNNSALEKQSSIGDPNLQFMQQVSNQSVEMENAKSMGSLDSIIVQGQLIHAVMESAINSDLPGFVRASVSQPVYAEDGSRILIPVGSRLIGQYKSGMMQGQSRIFIVWTRLVTPRGISVALGSPGTDSLGVAGMAADEIDRHFWQRFGTATLLSLLSAGSANLGVKDIDEQNSAASYREAIANSFSQSANQALKQDAAIAPTLKIWQGKPVIVFVARDLSFSNAMKKETSNINIF